MELIQKVKNEIKANQLIKQGDILVVGVSGGADSVALLLILHSLQNEFGLKLIAAHFNHNLRVGSKRDELFVSQLCQKLNIEFVRGFWQAKKSVLKNASEDLARENRFDFFQKVVQKYKADAIVLAHHQDDVAETVLMRILRGSGLTGLRAIMPISQISGHKVIRPLLKIQRKQIEAFIKSKKQKYCQDPTNVEDKYFRNKIRLQLIPFLEKSFSPQIKELLANLADSVSIDYSFLELCAQDSYLKEALINQNQCCFKIKSFIQKPQAMQRMMIRLAVKNLKGNLNQITLKHILEVEDLLIHRPDGSVVDWPEGIVFKKDKKNLLILKKN